MLLSSARWFISADVIMDTCAHMLCLIFYLLLDISQCINHVQMYNSIQTCGFLPHSNDCRNPSQSLSLAKLACIYIHIQCRYMIKFEPQFSWLQTAIYHAGLDVMLVYMYIRYTCICVQFPSHSSCYLSKRCAQLQARSKGIPIPPSSACNGDGHCQHCSPCRPWLPSWQAKVSWVGESGGSQVGVRCESGVSWVWVGCESGVSRVWVECESSVSQVWVGCMWVVYMSRLWVGCEMVGSWLWVGVVQGLLACLAPP